MQEARGRMPEARLAATVGGVRGAKTGCRLRRIKQQSAPGGESGVANLILFALPESSDHRAEHAVER